MNWKARMSREAAPSQQRNGVELSPKEDLMRQKEDFLLSDVSRVLSALCKQRRPGKVPLLLGTFAHLTQVVQAPENRVQSREFTPSTAFLLDLSPSPVISLLSEHLPPFQLAAFRSVLCEADRSDQ